MITVIRIVQSRKAGRWLVPGHLEVLLEFKMKPLVPPMTSNVLGADAVAAPVTQLPPRMLHHAAYVTHDAAATAKFYTEVLGMELISAVVDDAVPSTGDPFPYIHIFFRLGDGSSIAFFESVSLPPAAPVTHPAYDIFNHIALDVGSCEEVERWAQRLRDHNVEFIGPVHHGIIFSIYFRDPNGLRLELTATIDPNWQNHALEAREDLQSWIEAKGKADPPGGDASILVEWIKSRRRKHRLDGPDPRPGED